MRIYSPAFGQGDAIPARYTCDGENVNPELRVEDIPEKAKSLVLIVDDPDAPGKTWLHWTVWNIAPTEVIIRENSVPEGAREGMTDFGKTGYGGPCPPSGDHHYFFRIYALDTELALNAGAKLTVLEKMMEGHVMDEAVLMGVYGRKSE